MLENSNISINNFSVDKIHSNNVSISFINNYTSNGDNYHNSIGNYIVNNNNTNNKISTKLCYKYSTFCRNKRTFYSKTEKTFISLELSRSLYADDKKEA